MLSHLSHRARSGRLGDPGEGLRPIDRPYPLTPARSPWERGNTAFVELLSFKSPTNLAENVDGPCPYTPQRNRTQLLAGLRRCAVDAGALDRVLAVGVSGGAVLPVAGGHRQGQGVGTTQRQDRAVERSAVAGKTWQPHSRRPALADAGWAFVGRGRA